MRSTRRMTLVVSYMILGSVLAISSAHSAEDVITQVYKLQHINPEEMERVLRKRLPDLGERVHFIPHPRTNALIITATPTDQGTIAPVIKEEDTQREQILLQVLLVETDPSLLDKVGAEWTEALDESGAGTIAGVIPDRDGALVIAELIAAGEKIPEFRILTSSTVVATEGRSTEFSNFEIDKKDDERPVDRPPSAPQHPGLFFSVTPDISDTTDYVSIEVHARFSIGKDKENSNTKKLVGRGTVRELGTVIVGATEPEARHRALLMLVSPRVLRRKE